MLSKLSDDKISYMGTKCFITFKVKLFTKIWFLKQGTRKTKTEPMVNGQTDLSRMAPRTGDGQ